MYRALKAFSLPFHLREACLVVVILKEKQVSKQLNWCMIETVCELVWLFPRLENKRVTFKVLRQICTAVSSLFMMIFVSSSQRVDHTKLRNIYSCSNKLSIPNKSLISSLPMFAKMATAFELTTEISSLAFLFSG